MKIYTIENDTINEHEVTESMSKGFSCSDKFVGCNAYVGCDELYPTWEEAHAVLEDQARINLESEKRRLDVARSYLEKVRTMKEPK